MRTLAFESLTLQQRAHARGGLFRYYQLLEGTPGTPGNFNMQISVLTTDFESPRHRHNFDQVRYQLEGAFDFAADGRMNPGSIAYFPEGTRYGPQTSLSKSSATLVLQFGGAGGNGFMSEAQFQQGLEELKPAGEFHGGIFTRAEPGGGIKNQDAYQAVWEHVNGRELVYPKERYARPAFMAPENFEWLEQESGVATKLMGVFSECAVKLAFHRVEKGARLLLEGNSLWFVCAGSGESAGNTWRKWTTIHLESGERGDLRAAERSELLQIRMPGFLQQAAQRAAA